MILKWLPEILCSIAILTLLLVVWMLIDSLRSHRRQSESLSTLNLQVAFIAGRIGLTNRDLVQAEVTPRAPGTPSVDGDAIWDDLQERIDLLEEKDREGADKGHGVATEE